MLKSGIEMFKQINVNPHGVLTQDCVIRALTLFLNKPYEKVLSDLLNIYKRTGYHIGDTVCFMQYLNTLNITDRIDIELKYKLSDMCVAIQNNNFKYFPKLNTDNSAELLVLLKNSHLTYVKNGIIYDTWNCSTMPVMCCFIKKNK